MFYILFLSTGAIKYKFKFKITNLFDFMRKLRNDPTLGAQHNTVTDDCRV